MNRSAYLHYFFCLIFSFAFMQSRAQNPSLSSVQGSLNTLADNFPQEKIYIQFDKPTYAPGETVWFKAYMFAGFDPSTISKTIYIDFMNGDGRVLKHCIQPVLQSSAAGDYGIPLETKDEFIYVKAYTKWMLNFDSSFLFRKTLRILQSKSTAKKIPMPAVKTSIQFFPEGGYAIENVESNIAFKAIHYDGTPAPVKGAVFNNNNQQVAEINTVHDGMGSFLFTCKTGETYTAKWKDDLGNSYQTKLPVAKESGVALKISWQPNARSFLVQRSENAPANLKKLYIVATMQQRLVYAAGINLSESEITGGAIPTANLPTGILQVSLFDSNWIAVAERITFVNNSDYFFEPEVGFAQLGIEKRKQNILVIKTPDTVSTNLSVAITDAGIGIDSSDDIVSKLLLTSDIKGKVHYPHYYFQNAGDTLQKQLDLVMLTNGWRRINWDSVLREKYPVIKYQNEPDYLSLSGKVFGATEQDLKRGAFVLLIINNKKDTANRFEQAVVDGSGKFSNPNLIMYDTSRIYYRISGTESFANSSVVSFNTSLSSPKMVATDTTNNAYYADTATENYKQRLADAEMKNLRARQGHTLADITVKTKAKSTMQLLDEKYASPLFSGDAYQFDIVNDPATRTFTSVFNYLQGRVAGLYITNAASGSGGAPSISWRGGTPTFFLNETQVDVNNLSTINMNDVAYIKVFRPPFIGATGGGSAGAIAIYTRKGGDEKVAEGKGMPYKMVIGYTAQKEFYSPDYNTFNERNEESDLRSTLLWVPTVTTSPGNTTIRLKFYNNDFSKSFRVIVEGVSSDGKLTRTIKLVE